MKISICDDESKILEEIASFVEREFPSARIKSYSDGTSFISSGEERPDVLLIDIDMPGMSGMDVAAALALEKVLRKVFSCLMEEPSQLKPEKWQSRPTEALFSA